MTGRPTTGALIGRVAQAGAIVFALPVVGAVRHPSIDAPFTLAILGLLAAAVAAPRAALAALIVLLPVSALLQVVLGAGPPGLDATDAWVFAFVAGACLRVPLGPTRLALAGAALVAAVVASTLVDLAALQAAAPRTPLPHDIWVHVTTTYWTEPRRFEPLHLGARWTAWLLLAMLAERVVAGWTSVQGRRLVLLWSAAGALGGIMVLARIVQAFAQSEQSFGETLAMVAWRLRLSVLHPDLNAAGSYFALFLVPALAVTGGLHRRWSWRLSVPWLILGFLMARSRAAFGAAIAVLATRWARVLPGRRMWMALIAGVVALAGVIVVTQRSNVALPAAVAVRVDLAHVAIRTIARAPLFGVGQAEYVEASRRQITPEMTALRAFAPRGENAHNQYLQFAAELGIPALVLLMLLVVPVAAAGWSEPPGSATAALPLGLAAFLASALLGHPLLIPLVGTGFFLALGLASGTSGAGGKAAPSWQIEAALVVAATYVASTLLRI